MEEDLINKLTALFKEITQTSLEELLSSKELNINGFHELLMRYKAIHLPKYSNDEKVLHQDYEALIDLLQKILGNIETNVEVISGNTIESTISNHRRTEIFTVPQIHPKFSPLELTLAKNTIGGIMLIDINGKLLDVYSDESKGVGFQHEYGTNKVTITEYYDIIPEKDVIRVHYWSLDGGATNVEPDPIEPPPENPDEPVPEPEPQLSPADFEIQSFDIVSELNDNSFSAKCTVVVKNIGESSGDFWISTQLESYARQSKTKDNVLAGEEFSIEWEYSNLLPGDYTVNVIGDVVSVQNFQIESSEPQFEVFEETQTQLVESGILTWTINFKVRERTGLASGVKSVYFVYDDNSENMVTKEVEVGPGEVVSASYTVQADSLIPHSLRMLETLGPVASVNFFYTPAGDALLNTSNASLTSLPAGVRFEIGVENIGSSAGDVIYKYRLYRKYSTPPNFSTWDEGELLPDESMVISKEWNALDNGFDYIFELYNATGTELVYKNEVRVADTQSLTYSYERLSTAPSEVEFHVGVTNISESDVPLKHRIRIYKKNASPSEFEMWDEGVIIPGPVVNISKKWLGLDNDEDYIVEFYHATEDLLIYKGEVRVVSPQSLGYTCSLTSLSSGARLDVSIVNTGGSSGDLIHKYRIYRKGETPPELSDWDEGVIAPNDSVVISKIWNTLDNATDYVVELYDATGVELIYRGEVYVPEVQLLKYYYPTLIALTSGVRFNVGVTNAGNVVGNLIHRIRIYRKGETPPEFEMWDEGTLDVGLSLTISKEWHDLLIGSDYVVEFYHATEDTLIYKGEVNIPYPKSLVYSYPKLTSLALGVKFEIGVTNVGSIDRSLKHKIRLYQKYTTPPEFEEWDEGILAPGPVKAISKEWDGLKYGFDYLVELYDWAEETEIYKGEVRVSKTLVTGDYEIKPSVDASGYVSKLLTGTRVFSALRNVGTLWLGQHEPSNSEYINCFGFDVSQLAGFGKINSLKLRLSVSDDFAGDVYVGIQNNDLSNKEEVYAYYDAPQQEGIIPVSLSFGVSSPGEQIIEFDSDLYYLIQDAIDNNGGILKLVLETSLSYMSNTVYLDMGDSRYTSLIVDVT